MPPSDRVWTPWALFAAATVAVGVVSCESAAGPGHVEAITAEGLMAHIEFLADDSLYGRPAGWLDELRAAEYVRERFVAAGLAAGVRDYLQTFWIGEEPPPSTADPGDDPARPERLWSQNVIGVLAGSGALADEWIVVGAHYDHLGWYVAPDSTVVVYNGADDNASGTAVMLELARYLAGLYESGAVGASRRSILFEGFGAEEIGLVGSNYFCAHPTVALAEVAAMVNFDMVGRLRDEFLTVGGANSASWWTDRLEAVNDDGLTLYTDNKYVGRSDHTCFYEAGRPAIHLFTGMHPEYHTPMDDPPLINQKGLLQVAELAARLLLDLVTAPTLGG